MEPYFFEGTVLPQRAQLSFQFSLGFVHAGSGVPGEAKVSIILNQVAVWVTTEHDWDIFDLRNVIKTIIQNNLATVGYLTGLAYDLEITRVVSLTRSIDYVFGIDVPCIAQRTRASDLTTELLALQQKTIGPNGIYLNRCFSDLVSAMKNADDTGFYCYRAIEALCKHCAAVSEVESADRKVQWPIFREVAGCDEISIHSIKLAADPVRHGSVATMTSDERAKLLTDTWNIVEAYLSTL